MESEIEPHPFESSELYQSGRFERLLKRLEKISQLDGRRIPSAQRKLYREFVLSERDQNCFRELSRPHVLRADQAEAEGKSAEAFSERLQAWRKTPTNLGLLLDLVRSQISFLFGEPDSKGTRKRFFSLGFWRVRSRAVSYLQKAIQLCEGLEQDGVFVSREDRETLRQLCSYFPKRKLSEKRGKPWRFWIGFLLLLLLLILLDRFTFQWFSRPSARTLPAPLPPVLTEEKLLKTPVPVDWGNRRSDQFAAVIEKSERLKLAEFYGYEVSGRIEWKSDRTEAFELSLDYRAGPDSERRVIRFPRETDAPLEPGDTVVFREFFRLDEGLRGDDSLSLRLTLLETEERDGSLSEPVSVPAVDMDNRKVEGLAFRLRRKVELEDGVSVRRLGYDLEAENRSSNRLNGLRLRLIWRTKTREGFRESFLEREFKLLEPGDPFLPRGSKIARRLWVDVPENIADSVTGLTPEFRILKVRFEP